MKIKHLFGLAVIAAMTASCSSNEDLGTAGPGTGTNEAGVSYATFTINLPTASGTRAANDDFAEGTAKEYAVMLHSLSLRREQKLLKTNSNLLKLYHSEIWSLGKKTMKVPMVLQQKQLSQQSLIAQR